MKEESKNVYKNLCIPLSTTRRSGIKDGEEVRNYALANAVVVMKKRMTASELIKAAWALHRLSTELCVQLTRQCTKCEGQCGSCDGDCPYSVEDFSLDMEVPEEIREIAGIADDAILHAEFPEEGGILIRENDGEPCLWDIPTPLMEGFLASGVCPASLEELMRSGEVVYGD